MYGYDDSAERKIVRSFWEKTFNEQAVDTPNSWYHYFHGDIKALPGNVAIDLMVFKDNAYYGIEIEKMQESVYKTAKAKEEINIVLSKYYKYFTGNTNPNKMVFLVYNGLEFTGKILIIEGSDIFNHIDLTRVEIFKTDNNVSGVTQVSPMPIQYAKEYQFGMNRVSVRNKHSREIGIPVNTRMKWNYGLKPRYTFQNKDLENYDKIRFKAYSNTSPFNEIGGFYELSSSDVDKLKCDYENTKNEKFKYIMRNTVEKYGQYFPCNKGLN